MTQQTSPRSGLQLRSTVHADGRLELSLRSAPAPTPGDGEILVRVEATPINPSDLGLLLGPADLSSFRVGVMAENPTAIADIPPQRMPAMKARLDHPMPVGNEGAGVVVEAGRGAEHLLGKTVALLGGAMYAQYRLARAADVMVLPEGITPAQGASCFVNPLTALGMVETMRREGHTALVHTAAASNLGQILNKICLKDGIALVNIVRSAEQAKTLRDIGAKYVCNSTDDDFKEQLVSALIETGATIAFDATGGGRLADQILTAMEAALIRTATSYQRYGSAQHKQVYTYGGLDMRPTELTRSYGMAWGVGGWLLTWFLEKIGPEAANALRQRVMDELTTTFASRYTAEISLAEAIKLDVIAAYSKVKTGEKYLINPAKA